MICSLLLCIVAVDSQKERIETVADDSFLLFPGRHKHVRLIHSLEIRPSMAGNNVIFLHGVKWILVFCMQNTYSNLESAGVCMYIVCICVLHHDKDPQLQVSVHGSTAGIQGAV